MNVVLLILIIIFIILLCNYLYRRIKGMPDKSLKETWSDLKLEWCKYKQESKEDWDKYKQKCKKIDEKYRQKTQTINEEFAKKKEQKDLVKIEDSYKEIYEEYKNFSIDERGKFLHNLLLNDQDEYVEVLRFIQIAEESVDIALKSKNKDVAESRRKLALEMEQKIQERHPKAYGLIAGIIQFLKDNYDVSLFENQCIKYYEDAKKLKTIKSRQKRIDCINDLIKEAEINPKIDKKIIDFWKNKVKEI
ncbi:hypothetical protein [Campylobacter sp. CNRCH_2014_0184h]|uniref:hypothetical protein n=1 Tax=Campylobacter sp. CNRCH_2014_0184h TaxID=2911602 RepID=UPI0021E6947E|nr:hypothetical protein [Campylobacter sp. CNRCH_2014_0184h]MCV3482124.1 hypothetical protein [Campylobacter sp. CNRCH_2014_0184h]